MHSTPVEIQHKLPPIKALTPIRFFAAIYVILFHDGVQNRVGSSALAARFFRSGYTSVTLFFVLSGFILAYNYQSVPSPKRFWIARFSRIYPVYLLATAVMLVFALRDPSLRRDPAVYKGLALVLGLVQAWWPRYSFSLNGPAWTLSVEMFFYALFPAIGARLARMSGRTFVALQALYLAFICVPFVLQSSMTMAEPGRQLAAAIEGTIPLFRLDAFVVGCYTGAKWATLVTSRRTLSERSVRSIHRYDIYLAAGTIGSLLLLCTDPPTVLLPVRTLLLIYTDALLLLGLANRNWPVLTNHWMQLAGEISYGMYILQVPVLHVAYAIQRRLASPWQHPFLLQLVLLPPVCYAVHRWIEIPSRLLLRTALTGRLVPTRPL